MSARARLTLSLIGLLLLAGGIIAIFVGFMSPVRRISYSTSSSKARPSDPLFLVYSLLFVLAIFFIIYVYTHPASGEPNDLAPPAQPRRARILLTVGSFSLFITLTALLAVAGAFLASPGVSPPQSAPDSVKLSLDAPETLRMGTSIKVELTARVVSDTNMLPAIPLVNSPVYSATARLQAPSFDVASGVEGVREAQPLTPQSPARWAWVIAPKQNYLGSQEAVFDVFVVDKIGRQIRSDYLSAKLYVTDPLGIPPAILYLGTTAGGVLTFPLWAWLYSWWQKRRGEKAQEKEKQEQQRKPRPSPGTTIKRRK